MKRRILSVLLVALTLFSLFSLTACKSPTYMTIGGEEVSYDMVKSFVHNHRSAYTEEELRDEKVREEIREKVLSDLRMTYVIPVVAKELKVRLTSAMKDAIDEELEFYQSLGEEYEALLKAQNATEDVFETLLEFSAYDDLVFDAITDGAALGGDRFSATNDVIDADLEKGDWYAAEYVVLYHDDVNRKAREDALKTAREAILAGSSFKDATASIKRLYPLEFYLTSDGAFTSTIYSEDFENTVKALKVGEVSEVIETYTADGYPCYMLIRRLAVSKTYTDENYNTVISYYLTREYAAYMKERATELEVVIADKYAGLDILDIE